MTFATTQNVLSKRLTLTQSFTLSTINLVPLYRVERIDEEGRHLYTVNGSDTSFPGVTTILSVVGKDALVPWAAKESVDYVFNRLAKVKGYKLTERFMERLQSRAKKQPRFAKERAGRNGTQAHNAFDAYINDQPAGPGNTPFWESFQYWLEKEKLRIVIGDTKVASLVYQFGGSIDVLLADENNKLIIGDFKTSKGLYDAYAYQISAYCQAFRETYGLDYIPEGVVVRFVKDRPCFERREVRDINDSFAGFKAALDLFNNTKLVHYKNRELVKPMKLKKEKAKP